MCLPTNPPLLLQAAPDTAEEDEAAAAAAGASYDYLLSMTLGSLTREKVEALKKVRCRRGITAVCVQGRATDDASRPPPPSDRLPASCLPPSLPLPTITSI